MATRRLARGGPATQGFVSKGTQTLESRCADSSVGMSAKRTILQATTYVTESYRPRPRDYFEICVILEPWIPVPAIAPIWSKITA